VGYSGHFLEESPGDAPRLDEGADKNGRRSKERSRSRWGKKKKTGAAGAGMCRSRINHLCEIEFIRVG
jgi:hypothetical protein